MTFSDAQVGTNVRTGETCHLLETREYDVAPTKSVIKTVVSFPVTINMNSIATRINEAGQLETVPSSTSRYNYGTVTLQPLGLMLDPAMTNLVSGDMVTAWSKDKVSTKE